MKKKKIPIGIEDFKRLIDKGCYFVDKSLLIRDILDSGADVHLFTRPRRFGKTLNQSMIQYFFEKQDTNNSYLFKDLNISRAGEEYMEYQGKYPVITLSFKGMKKDTFEEAITHFKWMMSREYERHPEIMQSEIINQADKELYQRVIMRKADISDYSISVQFLTDALMKIHGKKAIVLIDEYDVPLENAHFMGFYDKMVSFIRSLFESALKTNSSLEMAVLTGCLRVSKESLFTGLNNLQINSIQSGQFSEYFGFTESEVIAMTEYFELSDKFSSIKEWYDGYRFGETEIYNPWSVLNYMQEVRTIKTAMPAPYWSNTSSNSIIRQLITNADEDTRDIVEELVNGGSITAPVHEDMVYADIEVNQDDIWSFLLFTGYLKLLETKQIVRKIHGTMVIPNQEVLSIYENTILDWFKESVKNVSRENLLNAVLSEDVGTLNQIVGTWLKETISFYDEKENYYHGFMAGLLSGFKGYKLKSNRESGDGRPDLLLLERYGRKVAVIFELKASKERTLDAMVNEALQQIEDRHYDSELIQEGYQKIIKYGVAFREKTCLIKLG